MFPLFLVKPIIPLAPLFTVIINVTFYFSNGTCILLNLVNNLLFYWIAHAFYVIYVSSIVIWAFRCNVPNYSTLLFIYIYLNQYSFV